jgi:MFS family permease
MASNRASRRSNFVLRSKTKIMSTKGFYALILPAAVAVFGIFLTIGIGFGVLPQFIHGKLGYGVFLVGIVVGVQDITALCVRSIAGKNTDLKGARSSVIKGIVWAVVSGVGYIFAGLAANTPLFSLALLLVARIMHGLSESYLITGALTWGIGLAGVQRSGKVMAWVGISIYAGIGVGASLGDWMNAKWDVLSAFALITILPILGSLPMFKLPAIPASAKKREASFFAVVGEIWQQGTSLALSAIGYACISSFIALLFLSRGWGQASLAFAAFAATFILARLFFASFPDKYGGYKVGVVSAIIELVGQLLLWLAVSRTMALAGCALTGAGFSLMFPAMGVEAVRKVRPEMRGSAMGAYTAFTDLALGVTGPIAGSIAGWFGYHAIYLFGGLCSVLSLVLIIARSPRSATKMTQPA